MVNAGGNVSVNDFLLELVKASERLNTNHNSGQPDGHTPMRHPIDMKHTSTPIMKAALGYPEVTLHPVPAMQDASGHLSPSNAQSAHSNSLLHGILTKVRHSKRKYCIVVNPVFLFLAAKHTFAVGGNCCEWIYLILAHACPSAHCARENLAPVDGTSFVWPEQTQQQQQFL